MSEEEKQKENRSVEDQVGKAVEEALKKYMAPQPAPVDDDEFLMDSVESTLENMSGDRDVNKAYLSAYNNDVFIQAVFFEEGVMRVSFIYKDEFTKVGSQERVINVALDEDNYKILFCEFQDRLEWLINDFLPKMRHV